MTRVLSFVAPVSPPRAGFFVLGERYGPGSPTPVQHRTRRGGQDQLDGGAVAFFAADGTELASPSIEVGAVNTTDDPGLYTAALTEENGNPGVDDDVVNVVVADSGGVAQYAGPLADSGVTLSNVRIIENTPVDGTIAWAPPVASEANPV